MIQLSSRTWVVLRLTLLLETHRTNLARFSVVIILGPYQLVCNAVMNALPAPFFGYLYCILLVKHHDILLHFFVCLTRGLIAALCSCRFICSLLYVTRLFNPQLLKYCMKVGFAQQWRSPVDYLREREVIANFLPILSKQQSRTRFRSLVSLALKWRHISKTDTEDHLLDSSDEHRYNGELFP